MTAAYRLCLLAWLVLLLGELGAEEQGTHREGKAIKPGGSMLTMAMDAQGNLLSGIKGEGYSIHRHDQGGKRLARMKLDFPPAMLHGDVDGSIYVAGGQSLARLDQDGKELARIDFHAMTGDKDGHAAGLTASKEHVFFAVGYGRSLRATEDIYKLDKDLTNPERIIEQQYGCCAHIDLDVVGDELLVAENSRFRINRYDFDGKLIKRWGKKDRTAIEGFTACCNPVCIDSSADGKMLYTAESGVGRIKIYSPDGKYLGLVGYVDTTKFMKGSRKAAASCYIPIEANDDGSKIFVMDVRAHSIRVLERIDSGS